MTEPHDLLSLDTMLSDSELQLRDRVRELVTRVIRPNIADWYERAVFPAEIIPELALEGLLGMHLHGYGCAGRTAVETGLAAAELEAGDSGIRTFVSVQGSLVMGAIHKHGSDEQKNEWLPQLATGEAIGCFGLTEPSAGSDPATMTTFARRDGNDWILDGQKRWIGFASMAQVAVIWAQTDDGIRGFLVPTDTRGLHRDADRAETLDARIHSVRRRTRQRSRPRRRPASRRAGTSRAVLVPQRRTLRDHLGRDGGSAGQLRGGAHLLRERLQFGKPLSGYQLTQAKLVDMALELNKGFLLALQLGRLKDAGKLEPYQISVGKLNNTREALAIAREARSILGGNGITLDHSPLRHANNLESVRTYEGTDEVHTLILGNRLTGISAFR